MRILSGGSLILLGAALAGCFPSLGTTPTAEAPVAAGAAVREDTRMTLAVLDQNCQAFGERYVNAVRNGTDSIERFSKNLEARSRAHNHKLRTATSVYDILSGPSPFAKLMDLVILAELQYRVWVTDKFASIIFGADQAQELIAAHTEGRADVWRFADKVLKPDQRKIVEDMIDEWRKRNPDAEAVAFVRFNEFSEYRGKSILDEVPLGSGLLAPVSEAMRQIEETRMLAERGLYLTKRIPQIAQWRAEAFLNSALLHPEVQKITETAVRVASVLETLPAKIAEERAIIMKRMEEREKAIGAIAQDVRATAADVKDIVKEIHSLLKESEGVVKAADSLVGKLTPPEGAAKNDHPFDIREYTAGVRELRELLESPAWTTRLSDINQTAQSRVKDTRQELDRLVDTIFWRSAVLIVLVFGLAVTYRLISRRAAPRP